MFPDACPYIFYLWSYLPKLPLQQSLHILVLTKAEHPNSILFITTLSSLVYIHNILSPNSHYYLQIPRRLKTLFKPQHQNPQICHISSIINANLLISPKPNFYAATDLDIKGSMHVASSTSYILLRRPSKAQSHYAARLLVAYRDG